RLHSRLDPGLEEGVEVCARLPEIDDAPAALDRTGCVEQQPRWRRALRVDVVVRSVELIRCRPWKLDANTDCQSDSSCRTMDSATLRPHARHLTNHGSARSGRTAAGAGGWRPDDAAQSTPYSRNASATGIPAASFSRIRFSLATFSSASAITSSATAAGTTTTPSWSASTRSPSATDTPPQEISIPIASTSIRPRESVQ